MAKALLTISRTFIPFLIILLLLISAIIYFDGLAEELSDEPKLIVIEKNENPEGDDVIWQYETENNEDHEANEIWHSDSIYTQALKEYNNEKWEEAADLFSLLNDTYPQEATFSNYLGLINQKNDYYSKSIDCYKEALRRDQNSFSAYLNLGIVYTRIKKFREAETNYLQASSIQPNHPKPFFNLGILYSKQEQWEKATDNFIKAISLSSGDLKAKAHYFHGISQIHIGDTVAAKRDFREAILLRPAYQLARIQQALLEDSPEKKEASLKTIIKLNPNASAAYYYLAKFYEEREQWRLVEYNLEKAAQLNRKDDEILSELERFYIDRNMIEKAQTLVSRSHSPDTLPQQYFVMARIESEKSNPNKAIQYYDKAIAMVDDKYPEAVLNKAVIYKRLDKTEKAIELYKEAIALKEDYSEAYYNLGLAYQDVGENEQAIDNYRLAYDKDPELYKALYNIGIIFKDQEDYKNATDYFVKALEVKPDYLKALFNLASTFYQSGNLDHAITNYQDLTNKYPNYTKAWFNLGLAYKKNNQNENAIDAFENVISLMPEHVRAYKILGDIYSEMEEHNTASRLYNEALDLEPNNAEIRYLLANEFRIIEEYPKAIVQFNKIIQLKPKYRDAYDKLYTTYLDIGQWESAFGIREKELEVFPNAEETYELAREWHRKNRYKKAIALYKKAISVGKNNSWVHYWMGRAYNEISYLDQSIKAFKKTLQLDPKHKYAYLRLGEVNEYKKDRKSAILYYGKLVDLFPDFAEEKNLMKKINDLKNGE